MSLPTHFLLRRLHSLSGLVPIGCFLILHTYTNAKSLSPQGVEIYNQALADKSHIPFMILFEFLFIYIPLLFHAGYGIVLMRQGKSNVARYGYEGNIRYVLQRITGILALFFIVYHVYTTRLSAYLGDTSVDFAWMTQSLATNWTYLLYCIGTTAVSFHFANGIWMAMILWGVTVSERSQKGTLRVCMTLFVVLASVQWLILVNLRYYDRVAPWGIQFILDIVKNDFFR